MGLLNKAYVYLVGPIDNSPDRGADWRDAITPQLQEMGLYVINPLKKPTNRAKEDEETHKNLTRLLSIGDFDAVAEIMKEIRSVDLRFVDLSSFLIVNWDTSISMCGSVEEVTLANRQKKPILIRCVQGKGNINRWMFGMVPHQYIYDEWEELLEYVRKVDKGEEINKRWLLFNW